MKFRLNEAVIGFIHATIIIIALIVFLSSDLEHYTFLVIENIFPFAFCYNYPMIKLQNLISALEASWARDTAFDENDWSSENPARGQCVVSSLIVQDYFGGELLGYSVKGEGIDETHFVNQLADGTIIDTTRAQYINPVNMTPKAVNLDGFSSIREKRLSDEDTRKRYEVLKDRVDSYLLGQKPAPELANHLLTSSEIAVIPTDTVYGVVARAADPAAVARLYHLKRREAKPGTLVAASIDQLVDLGIERRHLAVAEKLWPGAVSVITPCEQNLFYIHQGQNSLAIRIPDDPNLLDLLLQTGPLLTSSANQPGEPPATTIDEAKAYFGNDVEWYEDGGYVNRDPSTVIRVHNDSIEVVRQGAISLDALKHK